MSNPLSMFRKHQYIFLVVFGVMLMVAFIVLPPLDDYLRTQQGPGSAGNPVVVSWKGGQFKESDLERQRLMHRVAVSYLLAVVDETIRRDGTPRGIRQGQGGQIVDPGIPGTMSEENLVHTHLLANKGEALGLVVSDEAIAEFLEQLSDETIQANEMGRIFNERLGDRYTKQQLLNQLRIELMAQRVRSMAEAGLYVAPYGTVQPIQAWDYFNRLNRRVDIEAVALDVDDYLDRVAEPTQAQLEALYEESKSQFSYPQSPEPGFRIRRKAAFQFVRADLNKFIEEEKAKLTITEAEIEKHYEENKAVRYQAIDLPVDPAEGDAKPDDGTKPPADVESKEDPAPVPPDDDAAPVPPGEQPVDPKPADAKPTDAKPADAKPEDPKPEAPKAETPKAEAPKTETPASADPKPAAESPAPASTTPPEAPAPAPTNPPPTPGEARRASAPREFFVSTQAEENQPPAEPAPAETTQPPAATTEPPDDPKPDDPKPDDPKPDDAKPDEAKPDEAKPDEAKPDEAKPDEAKPADAKPDDAKPDDAKPADATEPTTPPAAKPTDDATPSATQPDPEKPVATPPADAADPATPAATGTPAEPEAPKLRPLDDKLRQEIRDELIGIKARQPAQERLDKALTALRNQVTKLGRAKRSEARAANPGVLDIEASGPVDVDALAGEHGLTVGQIPLIDSIEAAEYELGTAYNLQFIAWPPTRENFTDVAFVENVRRYSATEIRGAESDIQFLYWKTDGEEPYVPDFKEARDNVVAAWKQIEARKIAIAEANNLKDDIASGEQTFEEKFAGTDREPIAPPAFSWMTTGFNPGGAGTPVLSDVEGVESPSVDFMKEVFSLKPGELGVAANAPKTKIYVVRVKSESPPEEFLKQLFLASGNSPEVQYIAYIESISLLREWYSDLDKEMGVKWLRQPDSAT